MRLWPLLISLYFPLCATTGANGIAPPGIVDFSKAHHLPHSGVLVGPVGFTPMPDILAPLYPVSPAALFAALQAVAAAEPRTYALDAEPARLQAAWVVRSAASNFPDVVEAEVVPEGGGSSVILLSRSIYGWFDFGVNAARAKDWLQKLQLKVAN
jgi:uncharacterized protein (DUF1499 family)